MSAGIRTVSVLGVDIRTVPVSTQKKNPGKLDFPGL